MTTADASSSTTFLRDCGDDDFDAIHAIISDASRVYRGAIPDDCWHEPYMSVDELRTEIARGVHFAGLEKDGELIGIMGWERVRNVVLIRHAYVRKSAQGMGVGSKLMDALTGKVSGQWLVGTWRDAVWAIDFYCRRGFGLLPDDQAQRLLQTYWTVGPRQREVSVVLARPSLDAQAVDELIAASGR